MNQDLIALIEFLIDATNNDIVRWNDSELETDHLYHVSYRGLTYRLNCIPDLRSFVIVSNGRISKHDIGKTLTSEICNAILRQRRRFHESGMLVEKAIETFKQRETIFNP